MTIANEINRLNNAKAAIKEAIINKGVTVSDSAKIDEYATLIDEIRVGGGGESGEGYENPGFYELLTNNGTDYNCLFYYKTINDISFIESLDTSRVKNMNNAFSNAKCLSKLDLSKWDVSRTTNIKNMFQYSEITELDVTGWTVSHITDMYYLFYNSKGTTITGLETWDTSKVTSFDSLFQGCQSLVSFNVSTWDTSKVTNMSGVFAETALEILDISNWDTSNVKNFGSIYWFISGQSSASKQKLREVIGVIDLSNCTSGMVYNTSYYCFSKSSKLETVYLKNIYKDTTIMKNELKWSINLKDTVVKDECLIYIINELPDLINDKGLTATDKIVLTLPPTNTLTAEQVQPAIDKGWNVANTTY